MVESLRPPHRGRPARRPGAGRAGRPWPCTGPSVTETIDDFLAAVDEGHARDRYGRAFTRAAAVELHWNLGGHVAEALGAMSLNGVRRRDVEALVYELGEAGLSHRRVRALAKSVRALFDYAVERELVAHNPAQRIALPDEDETAAADRRGRGAGTPRTRANARRPRHLDWRCGWPRSASCSPRVTFLAESL